MESPLLAARCSQYIRDDGFDWTGLFIAAQTMSSGEQLLIRIAHDLWTSSGDVGIWELTRRLDPGAFNRVLGALRMCRGAYLAARSQWLFEAA